MTSAARLQHPNQLTAEDFPRILETLQKSCGEFNINKTPQRPLLIRDFWFIIEDGHPYIDIFVEPSPGHSGDSPFPPQADAVSLDECLPLHHHLLESDALSEFDDSVGVRVGSLGIEPPLRTLKHFESAKGHLVTLKTWTKRQGRDRFSLLLNDVVSNTASPSLLLRDGSDTIEIPLAAVKFAQALLEKPKAAKANAPRKPKRG